MGDTISSRTPASSLLGLPRVNSQQSSVFFLVPCPMPMNQLDSSEIGVLQSSGSSKSGSHDTLAQAFQYSSRARCSAFLFSFAHAKALDLYSNPQWAPRARTCGKWLEIPHMSKAQSGAAN